MGSHAPVDASWRFHPVTVLRRAPAIPETCQAVVALGVDLLEGRALAGEKLLGPASVWAVAGGEDGDPRRGHARSVLLLRRIAYTLLALYRAVTLRSDKRRATPWKALLQALRDTLVAAAEEQLAGLRLRQVPAATR